MIVQKEKEEVMIDHRRVGCAREMLTLDLCWARGAMIDGGGVASCVAVWGTAHMGGLGCAFDLGSMTRCPLAETRMTLGLWVALGRATGDVGGAKRGRGKPGGRIGLAGGVSGAAKHTDRFSLIVSTEMVDAAAASSASLVTESLLLAMVRARLEATSE